MTIKVCGITQIADAAAAAALGVHAIGFVFWPSSPRAVTPARARAIIERLSPFVTPVGVFVDPDAALVAECRDVGIQVAQVVGNVPPLPAGTGLLRAVTLAADGIGITPAIPDDVPVLLDTHDPVQRGGTGRTLDWRAVSRISRQRPVILAGGLRPDNVGEAIRLASPTGVDVSSGVERAPGVKDHERLAAFVAAVRAVA
jgi:phosphoribosylanthranilate isomerase